MSDLVSAATASPDASATPAAPADAAVATDVRSLRDAVRDGLRGTAHGHDYTSGDIGHAIVLLAVPMVLEMAMESVFAVADVFYVGRLGAGAVATVGLTESMLTVVYTVAMGLSIGASALVARRVGERDPEGAARVAVQAIALGLLLSVGVAALGIALAPRLLALMGASADVVAGGSGYTRTMLGGSATVLVLFLVNAIFRGAGDAAVAMRALWLANAINIALAPVLIFGPGPLPALGVTGAAIATTIGRGIGALYVLSRLVRPGARVRVRRRHLRADAGLMGRVLSLSGAGTLQVLIGSASWIGLVRIVSSFGSDALAGYTIAMRVVMFALLPSWGMSNAAATMVGQALGAAKPERADAAVWRAGRYNLWFLGVVGVLFALFARPIVGVFTSSVTVLAHGTAALRIVALGFPFYAYGMVLGAAFNGAGDTRTPTWTNFLVFWLWEIPLAWVLAGPLGLGPRGVFWAVTVAFSTLAVVNGWLFRRGRWKGVRV